MATGARRIGGIKLSVLYVSILLLAGRSTLEAVFNASADPKVPTTVKEGLFFTRARIGNRDAGPFVIDSGAYTLVLDVELAKALNLTLCCEEIFQRPPKAVRYGTLASFQVGPMTLRNVAVEVKDFAAVSAAIGKELSMGERFTIGKRLAGALGFPFFAKAVIEVDCSTGSISCFDPKEYRLPRGEWQPLTLRGDLPTLTARLEGDIEGRFILDTGSTLTVLFHRDFVRKHALLRHRDATGVKYNDLGGESVAYQAKIAWFELAGHRFENPTVLFKPMFTFEPEHEGIDGTIGSRLLREFIVVFNYPESKIALLRK